MKDEFSGQTKFRRGFSTLEILIAMAILILVLSSVIMVAFGGQAILSDNEIAGEALKKAQELLEVEQARARKDFKLVNPIPEVVEIVGGLEYKKRVKVETASDYLTKKITSIVAWTGEHGRKLDIRLTALVTNFEYAVGGDTCNSVVTGPGQNWLTPIFQNYFLSAGNLLPGGMLGNFPVSDVEAVNQNNGTKRIMYVAVQNSSSPTNHTFFVFDATDSAAAPIYKGSIDNAPTVSPGFNAIHAAGKYIYAANGYGANFGPTTPCAVGPNCAQLQIINVEDSTSPTITKNYRIPSSIVFGSGGNAVGRSIFYKDGFVYLGLTKTEGGGPEFNIIDVHNPTTPFWVGGRAFGHDINAIYVRGKYAYVATAAPQELTIIDISNPGIPTLAGGFDAPGAFGNGKSVYLLGDTLYLGRTFSSEQELYILDNKDPNIVNPTDILGSMEAGSSQSINGIIIRDFLAFLLSSDQFRIFDVSNPAAISLYASTYSLSSVLPTSIGKTLECEGSNLYMGTVDASNVGAITVIRPGL